MLRDLTYVAAVILIPVVPAYLLYKYLPPGKAEVGGPFKGLDIKLSGAFAGYFLVLLIASSLLVFLVKTTPVSPCQPCPPPPPNRYEVYTVSGKIDLRKSSLKADSLTLSLWPAERTVAPDGRFTFDIPVKPGQGTELNFPNMLISSSTDDTVENKNIPLKPGSDPEYNLVFDHAAKTITIKSTLYLERRPKDVGESQDPKPIPTPSSQP